MDSDKKRCQWVSDDPLYVDYHDNEWGKPVYDDLKLFEFLVLEGMQAGLSWITILKKRDNYRKAFDNFDPNKIARYTPAKIEKLLQDPGIIRNRLKVNSIIQNAKAYLDVQKTESSFSDFLWQFVDGQPIKNQWKRHADIPTTSVEAQNMANILKKRGFKFVGETICYAFMQAVGMVDDHIEECFLYSIKN